MFGTTTAKPLSSWPLSVESMTRSSTYTLSAALNLVIHILGERTATLFCTVPLLGGIWVRYVLRALYDYYINPCAVADINLMHALLLDRFGI